MTTQMKCCSCESFETIKQYDPKPKNPDGSIRWFLYRWDDGKDGFRKLVRCTRCGRYFLVQCYRLNKFTKDSGLLYQDWYAVESEHQADHLNRAYTGPELERSFEKWEREYDNQTRSD